MFMDIEPEEEPRFGGSAFPDTGNGLWKPEPGMSLRDYFAAKCMQGLMANGTLPKPHDSDPEGATGAEVVARRAYYVADAMLRTRETVG